MLSRTALTSCPGPQDPVPTAVPRAMLSSLSLTGCQGGPGGSSCVPHGPMSQAPWSLSSQAGVTPSQASCSLLWFHLGLRGGRGLQCLPWVVGCWGPFSGGLEPAQPCPCVRKRAGCRRAGRGAVACFSSQCHSTGAAAAGTVPSCSCCGSSFSLAQVAPGAAGGRAGSPRWPGPLRRGGRWPLGRCFCWMNSRRGQRPGTF